MWAELYKNETNMQKLVSKNTKGGSVTNTSKY